MKNNSVFVLYPYKEGNVWAFDDEATGLMREAFIAGADDVIEFMVKGIPKAHKGFALIFSPTPFPGHTVVLERENVKLKRGEVDIGTTYWCEAAQKHAWLCPALFRYFDKAADMLYAQAKPMPAKDQRKMAKKREPVAVAGPQPRGYSISQRFPGLHGGYWEY